MPLASVHLPMTPPRASISRTICPFATPPIAGLQLIWATASAFIVSRHVLQAQPGGGHRGLDAGVPGPDHDHIEPVLQRTHVATSIDRNRCSRFM